jgi:glycosyltransferase involved in cell wall biosynthesis
MRCLAGFADVRVLAVGEPEDPGLGKAREALAGMGVDLRVFGATGPGSPERDPADTRRLPDSASHFRSPALLEALSSEPAPDVLHVEEMVMAQYAAAVASSRVIDRQKVEWDHHRSLAAGGGDAALWHEREAARFRRWESATVGLFDRVLVTGRGDASALAPFHGAGRIHVAPIGVDDAIRRPPGRTLEVRHVLLFGSLDYAPNVEAAETYFRDVWPRLGEKLPELRTVVAGAGPIPAAIPAQDARVEIRGYVPDVRELLCAPGVLVVPLRVGGGSRTKVLEALAAGMPVISTEVGVENLGLEPGRHFLRAESAQEMAEALERLVREPDLVAAMGQAGARLVDERFRWQGIGKALRPVYEQVAGRRRRPGAAAGPARGPRVLLIGVWPWPRAEDATRLSFGGHRTEQFFTALTEAECAVEAVLLDEERGVAPPTARTLSLDELRSGRRLQEAHDAFGPDVVVAVGGYHTIRAAVGLHTDRPRLLDLGGDLAAEGQLRAVARPEDGIDALAVLGEALAVGDYFTVVGPSQRLACLGQLGLAGRLTGTRVGREPVGIVPLASRGPREPKPPPGGPTRLLWAGGYNTWMDVDTLFEGLDAAFACREDLTFVSTGGVIEGHDEETHPRFWRRARGSTFVDRFQDLGRLPRREMVQTLQSCHVVLSISRPCLEAELGSRQRIVEALAHGRAVVATRLGDLSREVEEAGAGLLVPPSDASSLANALLRLAGDREEVLDRGCRGRSLWESRFTYGKTAAALTGFVARPERWPPPALADGGDALRRRLLRMQQDLDELRGSRTFRALRLLDRLTGRTARRS